MRSFRFLAVAVLAIVLAVSSLAYAQPEPGPAIDIAKVTSNGDVTTQFTFDVSGPASFSSVVMLTGGAFSQLLSPDEGTWTIAEVTPSGWVLVDISCSITVVTEAVVVGSFGVLSYAPQTDGSSFTVDLAGRSVTIQYGLPDIVECTFTNSPAGPVGGVVMPTNNFAIAAPWLAFIGLVGCVGTVVVVSNRCKKPAN